MLVELDAACRQLSDALAGLDPALLSGTDCARVVELLAGVEKCCAGRRALCAARAASCGAHRDRGFSDPAAWLADACGVSGGEARAVMDTAIGLDACPRTRDAVLAGELSLAQAGEITRTEAVSPGSEVSLLELADRTGVNGLRDAARKRRLEAQDDEDRYRRQYQNRFLRHWHDDTGMIRLAGALPPDIGMGLVNRLDRETDRLARHAHRAGSTDRRDMHAADALAQLVAGTGTGSTKGGRGGELVLVCDIGAYRRGHTHPGEPCQVIGGGPVPVSVARQVADNDPFIKAVLHDGVRIDTVAHYGRHIKAELRTALSLGAPRSFDGAVCVDNCDRRYHLQWDHIDPIAHHGPTSYDNLAARCWTHHQDKTDRDRAAGLLTPPKPNPP